MMTKGTVQLFLFATKQSNPLPVERELGLFNNPPASIILASLLQTSTRYMPS